MKLSYRQILTAAKSLKQDERERLRKSLESYDDASSATLLDDDFFRELERRRKYAEKNPDSCVSWDEFRRKLQEMYA